MNSIKFPDMFNRSTTNMVYDNEATGQNLEMSIWSNKDEMFGDPYYGCSLKKIIFSQNDVILKDLLIDDLYSAIKLFMPQVIVNRNDIKIISKNNGELIANIKVLHKADFTTDMRNIVLTNTEV